MSRYPKFLRKVETEQRLPFDPKVIKTSIGGINRLIGRFKRDAYRSNIPEYVYKREEKIEKLQLIVINLKSLL